MVEWIASWVWRIGWRATVTLACMYTFQNVIHQLGYLIPTETMFAVTSCAIIVILT